jgi:AAA domain
MLTRVTIEKAKLAFIVPANEPPLDDIPLPNGPEDFGLSDGEPVHEPSGQGASATSDIRPRFIPVAIDDVAISAEPAWLIDGLLPARGLACIVGPPKSGKSFLTSDMLCSVARGSPYAGRETLPGPVIYLTGEGVSGCITLARIDARRPRQQLAQRRRRRHHAGREDRGLQQGPG